MIDIHARLPRELGPAYFSPPVSPAKNADPSLDTEEDGAPASSSETSLSSTVEKNKGSSSVEKKVVKNSNLSKAGKTVNTLSKGGLKAASATALEEAADRGVALKELMTLMTFLLEQGISPTHSRDVYGWSPLILSAKLRYPIEVVFAVVDLVEDPKHLLLRDSLGRNVKEWIVYHGSQSCYKRWARTLLVGLRKKRFPRFYRLMLEKMGLEHDVLEIPSFDLVPMDHAAEERKKLELKEVKLWSSWENPQDLEAEALAWAAWDAKVESELAKMEKEAALKAEAEQRVREGLPPLPVGGLPVGGEEAMPTSAQGSREGLSSGGGVSVGHSVGSVGEGLSSPKQGDTVSAEEKENDTSLSPTKERSGSVIEEGAASKQSSRGSRTSSKRGSRASGASGGDQSVSEAVRGLGVIAEKPDARVVISDILAKHAARMANSPPVKPIDPWDELEL